MPKSAKPISRLKKFGFAVFTVGIFFVAVEFALAAIGVAPSSTRDPYVGFSASSPLFICETQPDGKTIFRTAPAKRVWFNDQSFAPEKPEGTRRIVCLGGSTTYGRPFDDATSYSGYLRRLLPIVDPDHRYEVINAGGVSYASYRVAAVMQEMAAHDVDLFIVYSVHNEFLERRTYASLFDKSETRIALEQSVRKTRLGAMIERAVERISPSYQQPAETLSAEVDERLNHTAGPSDYVRDDKWHAAVLGHYEFNLNRMVEIANRCGARLLLIGPASNEKDCSPFKSDNTYYEEGCDLFELAQYDDALAAFTKAIDTDICPLRATTQVGQVIDRVADRRDVPVVAFAKRLREQSRKRYGHECLGEPFFVDHVHPSIEVHRDLATWIIEDLQQHKWLHSRPLDTADIGRVDAEIRAAIDPVDQATSFRNLAKVLHWSGKYDEALRRAQDALRIMPEDAESRYLLAACLAHAGRYDQAITEYERLFEVGMFDSAVLPFGELLAFQDRNDEAKAYLTMATASPVSETRRRALLSLATLHQRLGEDNQAAEARRQLERVTP